MGFATRKADPRPGAGASRVRKTEGASVFGAVPCRAFGVKSALVFGRRRRLVSIFYGCDVWMKGLRG